MSSTAVILILLSAFMHAGWNFFSKKMYPTSKVYIVALTAGFIVLLPVVLVYADFFPRVPSRVWKLVFGAGFFQALYFSGLAGAYRNGDLSIAYPLARSSPVIVVMVMSFFLGKGDEISTQAVAGILIVVGAAFFLPMRHPGEFRLKNYINLMGLFALAAAFGTAGYSILDDAALRVLRSPEVLGSMAGVGVISFFYLFLEAGSTVFWMVVFFGAERLIVSGRIFRAKKGKVGERKAGAELPPGKLKILGPALMGVMIYATYGIVLISMAYAVNVSYIVAFRQISLPIGVVLGLLILKEKGGWLRFTSVVVMVAGLMLVSTG